MSHHPARSSVLVDNVTDSVLSTLGVTRDQLGKIFVDLSLVSRHRNFSYHANQAAYDAALNELVSLGIISSFTYSLGHGRLLFPLTSKGNAVCDALYGVNKFPPLNENEGNNRPVA